ncbi:anti-sigma factor RsiW [Kitasatospora sp. MAP12-15]|uniref:anti-sigma factor family protein n=1 Tax=unclassified Kitasatospora TaxID=2633591 RepID=UPI002473709C|nr:zf-HC2 domain-containing protein [Kitasatospora sp. MAP12-44]MDH6109741.1 anti-sigma factor RsiW [Kitasatospora sp. MAP12-44]
MTGPRGQLPPQDPHLDVGAYLLGVLDEEDRAAFEAHLAHCPQCAAELAELGELKPLLAELAGSGTADPLPAPGPRLLEGLLGEVRAVRRRRRSRRLALVAAAAVLVVGGPGVTAAVLDAGSHPAVQAGMLHSATATTAAGAVSATVGVTDKAWGSAVTLRLDGVSGPRECDLVAVSTSGQRQTVTSWYIGPTGYGSGPAQELRTAGGAGFHAADISHFDVQDLATGRVLVSIPTG